MFSPSSPIEDESQFGVYIISFGRCSILNEMLTAGKFTEISRTNVFGESSHL